MKSRKDEKWLDETISRAVDFGEVKFDVERWKEKNISNKSEAVTHSTIPLHRNSWRFIMESSATKYSAAVIIILAMALLLSNPFGLSRNGGVVLADVQRKIDEIETMIIRGTKTFTHPDEDGDICEFCGIKCQFDLMKYSSIKYGLVEEGYIGDELIYRVTFNRPERQTLLVVPPCKKYVVLTSTDKQMQLLENLTPKGFMNLLLKGYHRKLGRDDINGVEAEAFEFKDTEPIKGLFPKTIWDMQSLEGKIWIGIEEQLPVRAEGNFFFGKSLMTMFNELNLHEVNTFGEYNVELDEEVFDIEPPEGYTELTLSDILSLTPTEVKTGLVGVGVSSCIIPAGLILYKRRRKNVVANQH